ncbi:unnamed protein product [Cuscuta campestris]|uniref:Uncharacterized protein n=1 Tax=Cuscuta campestris TaxID=132261 RepID=A0A484KRX9_9ASTE|nr:unnamed protein product [Cuscuta campestris]
MAKLQSSYSSAPLALFWKRRGHLVFALLVMLSVTTVIAFLIRGGIDSCDCRRGVGSGKVFGGNLQDFKQIGPAGIRGSPLSFMKSKHVLLVSHELSLSGNASQGVARVAGSSYWSKSSCSSPSSLADSLVFLLGACDLSEWQEAHLGPRAHAHPLQV